MADAEYYKNGILQNVLSYVEYKMVGFFPNLISNTRVIAFLIYLSQNQIYIKIVLYEKHYLWIWPKEYMVNTILFVIGLGEMNFNGLNIIKISNFVVPVQTAFRCPNLWNLVELILLFHVTLYLHTSAIFFVI